MNKTIRLFFVIFIVLSVVLVAQSQVARANDSGPTSISARGHDQGSVAAARDDDCEKDKGKDKDKDKCKGSVKPPDRDILIPVTGEYSVGGFCTLSVTFNDPNVTLDASVTSPLPHDLPDDVHKIRQGCLLTYHEGAQQIDELAPASGNSTICFAAIPKEKMVVYYYDVYGPSPMWVALETTVANGIACAPANASGIYVATFQNH